MVYDSDGNRVSETVGGTTTKCLVDSLNPTGLPQVIDELVSGAVTRTYAYGLQRISENQKIGTTQTASFYGYDGHGNVRFLTNSSGTVTDSYTNDAFGMPITTSGTTPNNFLYSGEQYDSTLGLYYLRARYYNPATGRFLVMDPYEGRILDPATLHKYVYAGSDPINGSDPTGRDAFIESLFTTTDIRTPLEVNAEIAARSVAEVLCGAAKFLANVFQNWPPSAPSPIGFPVWGIKGAAGLCTAFGF
jgi:RHS repeat-associated protein